MCVKLISTVSKSQTSGNVLSSDVWDSDLGSLHNNTSKIQCKLQCLHSFIENLYNIHSAWYSIVMLPLTFLWSLYNCLITEQYTLLADSKLTLLNAWQSTKVNHNLSEP